ncbi:MAG: hypothetical protein JXR53_02740 [Bacteroidales bacterium]|nr:hypothetical protein [Bacteroidales bacterium]
MKNKILLVIITVGVVFSTCSGQKSLDELILGTWEQQRSNEEILLYFQEGGTVDFTMDGAPFKGEFTIKTDSTLIMGNRIYKILTLTDSVLILREGEYDFGTVKKYQRSDKVVEPIPEYVDLEEYYENGQLRVKGRFYNGFQDGNWVMYYETGEVLSVQYFSEGIFLEKPKYFDKDGNEMSDDEYYEYIDEHWPKAE